MMLAKHAESYMITTKSKSVYEKTYKTFQTFLQEKKIRNVNEKVLLGYFHMLGRSMAPKSLWAIYSMLKRTLHVYDSHQIENYHKLTMFLSGNEKASTHVPKQASTFTATQIQRFIEEAPAMMYLPQKVTAIIGIHDLCRAAGLCNLTLNHAEDHHTCINFVLERTKNGQNRGFSLTGGYRNIVKKYLSLRPSGFERKNLFIKYSKGQCHRQVIGIHAIAKFPKQIATYLDLANPNTFTGHSFRRTGATIAAEAGVDFMALKKLGGWKSSSTPHRYTHSTQKQKNIVSSQISNAIRGVSVVPTSTSTMNAPSASGSSSPPAPTVPIFAHPTTSDHPESSTKKAKLNIQSFSSAAIVHQPIILAEQRSLIDIPRSSGQTININFSGCSNFNIFTTSDKENHP
ncbi:uncharacterized protein LOC135169535 [Diachasmimorpha longicaudata]|uniref:uncharacterized protein LOC135169535 n=1 Tax=Diachasmimorpha longicaudata TaxID=58733 RepID=UPI0030B8B13F